MARCGQWRSVAAAAALGGVVIGGACAKGGGSATDIGLGGSGTTTTGPSSTGSGTAGGGTGGGGTSSSSSTSSGTGGQGGAIGPCDEDPCKVTPPQCGCPGSQRCVLNQTGDRTCTAAGDKNTGEACTGDCSAGNMCLALGNLSTCYQFCDTDQDCSGFGAQCVIQLNDGNGGTYPEHFCSVNCDPVSSTGCNVPGSKCELGLSSDPNPKWFTLCAVIGSGSQGADCTANGSQDCATGFGCFGVTVNNQNENWCLQYCNLASPVCPGTTTCTPYPDPAMLIGSVEYGACL